MRTLTLLFALCIAPVTAALAQEAHAPDGTLIESAEVSGLPMSQLSPGLRQAIDRLVGTPLSKDHLADLAARIEAEQPEMVAAIRTVPRPEAKARVVFLVARVSDDANLQSNINTRYVVEDVSIAGIAERLVSQALRDELQTLVGHPLDQEQAEKLRDRLASELPGRRVNRRISRGSQRGQIHVVFDVDTPAWIPFAPSRSKFLYHGDQGWSGVLDISGGGSNTHVALGLVFSDKDELIENYRGYRFRVESRKLGTERVGASVELSWLRQSWEQVTLDALALEPATPGAYRTRRSIDPSISFAFNPHLRVWAGLSSTELQPIAEGAGSIMANAFVASIGYDRRWRASSGSHRLEAGYKLRSTSGALDSELDYTRHLAQARYQFDRRNNTFVASFMLGHLSGQAPLFERFSLGDTTTLRGWNKFDIAPTGGAHVYNQTLEYRLHHVALFLDTGSVWQENAESKLKLSAGFGFHGRNAFATFGFPLNAEKVGATFMFGVRF